MGNQSPKVTKCYRDSGCPYVMVWTECDDVQYSWASIYSDKIMGGRVACGGVAFEDENNTLYLRNFKGKWCSDLSPIGIPDDIAAHLDLVEETAAAYRLTRTPEGIDCGTF